MILPRGPALHEAAAGSACLIIVAPRERGGRRKSSSGVSRSGTARVRTLSGPTSLFFEASRIVDHDPETDVPPAHRRGRALRGRR